MEGMDITKLAELLHDPDEDKDKPSPNNTFTPGSIGPPTKPASKTDDSTNKSTDTSGSEIWQEGDVEEETLDHLIEDDGRPEPEYDIIYKQRVTADDAYLGMSGKNPSTACCEDLVVRIKLPDIQQKDIDLDVKDKYLICKCPKYQLLLQLPHKVDSNKGNAKWDAKKEQLEVTLPLQREYDFMNF